MLIEHEMDITDLLKKKNTLQVIFRSVMAEAQNYRVGTLPYRMDASPATMNFLNIRKSTHAYGWSILPRILSAALYRDVEKGIFVPSGELENLMEERRLLQLLTVPVESYDGFHDHIEVRTRGRLPEDKERMLQHLDEAIAREERKAS